MKKNILLTLALAALCLTETKAQYIVSSLATPGAATFKAEEIKDGVITLPL